MNRVPGLAAGKPGAVLIVPLHWRAAAVAAFIDWPEALADRVHELRPRDVRFALADFFAIVKEGRPAEKDDQRGMDLQPVVGREIGRASCRERV